MKRYIIKFLIATSALAISAGCSKDYLETNPTDRVSQEEVFNTIEGATTALNGIYRFMFERTDVTDWNVQNKPGVGGILLGLDFMGEDLGISSGNWYSVTGEGNWQGTRNDNHQLMVYYYRTLYVIIGNANFILDNIDNIVASETERNNIKGQALVLRAYAYSYLVQFYGKRYDRSLQNNSQLGVPLVLKSTDSGLPRATVQEVYNTIIKDLETAIELGVTSRQNKSQANLHVAWGLRARVALTMQDYENAIHYANLVINSNQYPLLSREDYQKGFNDAQLSEFIWASIPSQDQNDAFGSFFAQIAYNANTSFMRANPKRINSALYDEISSTDIRKFMWEPTPTAENFPLPATTFARQPYMSRKFSIKNNITSWGDVPLMRSSEMHLILAEAYASSNQYNLAQEALYTFVSARDSEPVKSTNTGNQLLEEIWIHRRVELWGEGFRFLDLKRLNHPLDRRTVPNYVSSSVNNKMYVPAGDDEWQFLFPRAELEANPEVVQND